MMFYVIAVVFVALLLGINLGLTLQARGDKRMLVDFGICPVCKTKHPTNHKERIDDAA